VNIMRHDPSRGEPDRSPIFIGEVTRQSFATDDTAELLRVNSVTFRSGARNRLHHHAVDQVLIVTHGRGFIATETVRFEIEAGDVVLIPAGEPHWHGAQPGDELTHFSILTPGQLTIDETDGAPASAT
jgi:quercetin dioxygenase-like cupin family protein